MRWGSIVSLCLLLGTPAWGTQVQEKLLTARNLGTAHFHNEDYGHAAQYFAQAVEISKKTVSDRINWGLSVMEANQHEEAISVLLGARKLEADSPHVAYLLGIIYARLNRFEDAQKELERLIKLDPICAPAHYNLGMALKRLDRKDAAAKHWKKTLEYDSGHAPAYFALFNHYSRKGKKKEAKWAFAGFKRTKVEKRSSMSMGDVERSRYCNLLPYQVRPESSRAGEVFVKFRDVTKLFKLDGKKGSSAMVLSDLDNDGDPDLWWGGKLYRNDKKSFVEVTSQIRAEGDLRTAAAGDLNGDGELDLILGTGTDLLVYEGKGDLTFQKSGKEIEKACGTKMGPIQIQPVDYDHEGDLDLLLLCASSRTVREGKAVLLRNNGNNTFTDVTKVSKLNLGDKGGFGIIPSDFDGKNDIDFFFPSVEGGNHLFLNQRDGTFRNATQRAYLALVRGLRTVARGDLNGDGASDLVLVSDQGEVTTWKNQHQGRFFRDKASPALGGSTPVTNVETLKLVDIDNDGDLDLFLSQGGTEPKLSLFRNDGLGGWAKEGAQAFAEVRFQGPVRDVLAADLDQDGDQDFVLHAKDGSLTLLRNEGGNKNRVVRVRLSGRKNNSDGYGAKVWVRDGKFFAQRESFERWMDIGIGKRKKVQVLGVRWPTGIEQAEINPKTKKKVSIFDLAERPGLAESCPFVYAFDGKRFNFVTDILDTTPVGVSLAPGQPFFPNHREAILIEGERLRPTRDGWLKVAITQELAEITYLDQLNLYVVDHPEGTAVVPNDRFSGAPFAPFGIHLASQPRPPRNAWDGEGRLVRKALLRADRKYAFETPYISHRYPGITKGWQLTLDPGDFSNGDPVWLFLRGSMIWSEASVNHALSQNPDVPVLPISLEIIGRDGKWKRVREDVGLPAGIDKFLPVELTGLFESKDHRIRLSSTFALLWDQAFFSVGETKGSKRVRKLSPFAADLHGRGFSTSFSPEGSLPDLYDYQQLTVNPVYPILHAGFYTRYGRVEALLEKKDDEYVILAPGDEAIIDFPAQGLAELPEGWRRDYILDAEGYIKDGDWRTRSASTIEPLPYRGMKQYPPRRTYSKARHEAYLERYQTRMVPEDYWIRLGL